MTTAHLLASSPAFVERHRPGGVLQVGRVGLSRPVAALCAGATTVSVDATGWIDPSSAADHVVVGYPEFDVGQIAERTSGWRRAWLEAERTARVALDQELDAEEEISELRVARDAARAAEGGIFVVSSSMPIRDVDAVLEAGSAPVVSNRGASGIDGFVSTVLGVARAGTGVVALGGDLSMIHDQNGFLVEPRPSAVFVVVDNDGGGIFSFLPQAAFPDHFETVFGTPHGLSFADYARLHRLEYARVDGPEPLTSTILERRRRGGLHLVHVQTDRSRNVDAHRRVSMAVVEAIEGL